MRVAVAGGTGLVGRLVVGALGETGHDPVVLARSVGVDVETGTGLDGALAGCDVVVDVTNVATARASRSTAFFTASTGRLLDAGQRAGVRHLVVLSIIGVDRVGLGYYAGKRRQEEVVASGPLPWTVLRASQFHDFARQLLERTPGPLALVPRMLTRPVAAAEVAARLVELAAGPAHGMVTPITGPQTRTLVDMARAVLRAQGRRRLVVPVRLPGEAGRLAASGGLLPEGDVLQGRQTFDEYLRTLATARPQS